MANKHRGSDVLEYLKKVIEESPETKAEYERLGPRYEIITSIIRARKAAGLTQAELAERMQVSRPVVTRLESGEHEPRFQMIQRAADALGRELVVEFKPSTPAKAHPIGKRTQTSATKSATRSVSPKAIPKARVSSSRRRAPAAVSRAR